jgi:pimeloyl-ACP methyl ester carboxylesterase
MTSIVFVHGLTGDRETTWTHSNGTYWPRDLLPQALPTARIITFGYDADVVHMWETASTNGLYDHGKSLEVGLSLLRKQHSTHPILFVAHSLGGLVCEQALLRSDASRETHSIIKHTGGIVFMGTPHYGSSLASWGSFLTRLTSIFRATNTEIIAALQRGAPDLRRIGEEFQRILLRPDINMQIMCFYEELRMPVVGKIVESESAILRGYKNCSINADHRDMTKFGGATDNSFQLVQATLNSWMESLQADNYGARPVETNDASQRDDSDGGNRPTIVSPGFQNHGSISAKNVLQGQHLNGGTNTWNFN